LTIILPQSCTIRKRLRCKIYGSYFMSIFYLRHWKIWRGRLSVESDWWKWRI